LATAKKIVWYDRLNSGVILTKRGDCVRLCTAGTPDIYVILNSGVILWIECKAGKYRQDIEQKLFQDRVERVGHKYIVCRSSDEITSFV
jgi:hypothetical protein